MTVPPVLWRPTPERIERAELTRYVRWLEETRGLRFPDYASLWEWSTTDLEGFWASVWERYAVTASAPPERVLGSRAMPGAEWFPGARLNFAEHVLRPRRDDEVAIRHASELRPLGDWTQGELRAEVAKLAGGLRSLGVTVGDRVVAYMPNVPEAVAAMLACASIGAIWSSCSPDFGVRSVVDRFAQIEPKLLLTVDGYRYGGKDFDRLGAVREMLDSLPTVEHTAVLGYLDGDAALQGSGAIRWDDLRAAGKGEPLRFEQVPFDHPLWVLYSSGTTGLPKAIVHGHGGVLLETLKKMHLHVDLQADDRLFWFTTTGWMMWNFVIGALTSEASVVLYDGNPGSPDPGVLWELAAQAGVTTFGVGAAYISNCQKAGLRPADEHDLSRLQAVGSTGSPLSPEGFAWVYDAVGSDIWLFSTSGGTDVCTAFVGGVPTLPVYRGELQARSLGARVESWSPDGKPLVNEVGELVITEPMPSMPLFFWGDTDGSRYRDSYFDMFPGIWRHGDWIEITDRGTAIISGRSDATINRGGVRMGTSEIYRAVLTVDEVVDALVLDLPLPGTDGYMPLFVVLRDGVTLGDDLVARIRARVRDDCSPRHVPDTVVQIAEVPRTLSGKVLELPVKRILLGAPADTTVSRDSLSNPGALQPFEEMAAQPPYAGSRG
jgi:acetoacetyl-CoA synthetase